VDVENDLIDWVGPSLIDDPEFAGYAFPSIGVLLRSDLDIWIDVPDE
jgi:hypothetical protein